jgi:hypothetical protein
VTAGVFLFARSLAVPLGLTMPSTAQILDATGATRSRAYEIAREVGALVGALARPPGRPRAEHPEPPASKLAELRGEVLGFVMSHPGSVHLGAERSRYSESFRLFALELCERHADAPVNELAQSLSIPQGTLEDWLRTPRPDAPPPDEDVRDDAESEPADAKLAQIETVLAAWHAWHGDFSSFCEHIRCEHRLELGRTTITNILFAHGERTPRRRGRRSSDEHALRGAFEIFFPGAQWVADGKMLEIAIDGEVFRINLELVVDPASDAAVGIRVSDEEDSQAVCDAFDSGVVTTGEPPLALLLDNRPSNHTAEVDTALGDTMRIRATERRPQNKAHVEGAFGLFSQKLPSIALDAREPRALARSVATLVALTFFRALNRAPRRDRGGKTRVDLYAQSVSPEEREAARAALRERMRKQELARQTRAARIDPVVRALLDDAFARLQLSDPERHIRDAIACYPNDDVVDAIAIFDAKRVHGTLPDGVDARYLLGIARNLHHVHQADAITEALLRERLAARDRFLEPLVRERDAILASVDQKRSSDNGPNERRTTAERDQDPSAERPDLASALDSIVDCLVRASRSIDRHFWIDAAAPLVAMTAEELRSTLLRRAARRIHASFRLDTRDRERLVRSLLRRVWPLC